MDLAIRDVARFLDTYAPDELKRLTAEYPAARAQLQPEGIVLGTEDPRPIKDAVETMLTSISESSRDALRKTSDQLKIARRLELAGSMLAVCSSSSSVGSALISESIWPTAILGVIAVVANLVPLVVNWLRGTTTGANAAEKLIELRELAWEAQLLRAEIKRNGDPADWKGIVENANRIAKSAYTALQELGFDHAIEPV